MPHPFQRITFLAYDSLRTALGSFKILSPSLSRSSRTSERGAALPEFALTGGVILIFLLGIISIVILLGREFCLQYATSVGVRNAVVAYYAVDQGLDPSSDVLTQVKAETSRFGFRLTDADISICNIDNIACIQCGLNFGTTCTSDTLDPEQVFVVSVNGGTDMFASFFQSSYSASTLGVNSRPLKIRAF
jgi:hypothetical protein